MSDAVLPSAHVQPSSQPAQLTDVEAYYREIAPFYEAELADRDDLDFWRTLAADAPSSRILDLGAGSGAVTRELARSASLVVGVDLSEDLLMRARHRLRDYSHARLLRADMRALPLRASFNLIVAANDPFSHVTEDADRDLVLRAAAERLVPGGRFVLDALWLPPADAEAVRTSTGRVQRHATTMNGQPLQVIERWQRDPHQRRCCQAHYEYRRPGRAVVTANFEARDWTPDELSERLARAGLTITARWGSFSREPWNPRTSRHLIVEAVRPL